MSSTVTLKFPYCLVPTRITHFSLPRHVVRTNSTDEGLESRQIMSKVPVNAHIAGDFKWQSSDGLAELYDFYMSCESDHNAFFIPDDHDLWDMIPTSIIYRSYLPYPAWRLVLADQDGITLTPEGCCAATFSLVLKNLTGEGLYNPKSEIIGEALTVTA